MEIFAYFIAHLILLVIGIVIFVIGISIWGMHKSFRRRKIHEMLGFFILLGITISAIDWFLGTRPWSYESEFIMANKIFIKNHTSIVLFLDGGILWFIYMVAEDHINWFFRKIFKNRKRNEEIIKVVQQKILRRKTEEMELVDYVIGKSRNIISIADQKTLCYFNDQLHDIVLKLQKVAIGRF